MNHSNIEPCVRFEKGSHRFRGYIPAARQSDVRMKGAQIGLEARVDRGFLYAFVQLEKMRMPGPDADPENVRPAFAGKRSETGNGKEERLPHYGLEIFFEALLDLFRNVVKKTEGQMHLLPREPANAAQVRIQLRQTLSDGARKLEADEEPFRAHLLTSGRARLRRAERKRIPEVVGARRSLALPIGIGFTGSTHDRNGPCRHQDRRVGEAASS
jgi:hypothetical protein